MRARWFAFSSSFLLAPAAHAGLVAGGTMMAEAPKIDLNPRAVGGEGLPPIVEVAGDRFLIDQAELLGTFADFVNPTDARASQALASGASAFDVTGPDARKAAVAFEVAAKAFGVQFKTTGDDPSVVVMDDPKDALPPVELYEGDQLTLFFSLDLIGPDGSPSINRFGTQAEVVFDGKRAALVARTVVGALGAPEDGGYVWAIADGKGVVASATDGVGQVSDFDGLLALTAPPAPEEGYLFTFADIYTKGATSPTYQTGAAINGPGGSAVSLKHLPPHSQIRVAQTAHFIDDWAGEASYMRKSGSGTVDAESQADRAALDELLATYAGLGIQTASTPIEVVVDAQSDAPFAAASEGTMLVFGAASSVGAQPAFHLSSTRVDVAPDGRVLWSAIANQGSLTVTPGTEGWTVIQTFAKADVQAWQTTTYATAGGAVGAIKAWFGARGQSTDRVAVDGEDIVILARKDSSSPYRTILHLARNGSPEP